MTVIYRLPHLTGMNLTQLTSEEFFILEANLFTHVCDALKKIFKIQHENNFQFLKLDIEKENEMMEEKLVQYIIKDILSTDEYSLAGIARYTNIPDEVVYDLAIGKNTNPSSRSLRRIIELHRTVRPDLYHEIMDKVFKKESLQKPTRREIFCPKLPLTSI